jgi:hypothetical protein
MFSTASSSTVLASIDSMLSESFDDSSLEKSRMSLMRLISRSAFAWQMLSSSFCGGGSLWNRSSPRSSSEPLIEVSGVRTSCETTATNSDLSRSSSLVRSKRIAFVMAIVAWLASILSMSWSSVLKPPS